jgi:hypothetical protein
MTFFATLEERPYRVAMAFVTALRSLIESSMAHTGRTGGHRHGRHSATRAFSNDSSIAATRASFMSQRELLTSSRIRLSVRSYTPRRW